MPRPGCSSSGRLRVRPLLESHSTTRRTPLELVTGLATVCGSAYVRARREGRVEALDDAVVMRWFNCDVAARDPARAFTFDRSSVQALDCRSSMRARCHGRSPRPSEPQGARVSEAMALFGSSLPEPQPWRRTILCRCDRSVMRSWRPMTASACGARRSCHREGLRSPNRGGQQVREGGRTGECLRASGEVRAYLNEVATAERSGHAQLSCGSVSRVPHPCGAVCLCVGDRAKGASVILRVQATHHTPLISCSRSHLNLCVV